MLISWNTSSANKGGKYPFNPALPNIIKFAIIIQCKFLSRFKLLVLTVYDNYQYYYGTSPPSYFYADDCDCNKGDCPPGTTYQGSCGDDMNYCC